MLILKNTQITFDVIIIVKMKKIIPLLVLFSIGYTYSQEGVIVPYTTPAFTVPAGTYKKDLNNVLDPYVGTWQGMYQGKQFILKIEKQLKKLIQNNDPFYYYRDLLVIKYKITGAQGVVIADNLNVANDDAKIVSLGIAINGKFDFSYADPDYCHNMGTVRLKGDPASNHLEYHYMHEAEWEPSGCPYTKQEDIPIPLPLVTIVLTRL